MNRTLTTLIALFTLAPLAACDVDLEDDGEFRPPKVEMKSGDIDIDLPEAEVVDGGEIRAPDIEVTPPKVDVDTKTIKMKVPDIDVETPDENAQ